jgi:hypothetical protein
MGECGGWREEGRRGGYTAAEVVGRVKVSTPELMKQMMDHTPCCAYRYVA